MKQDISSLMDGELPSHEADRVIRTCSMSEEHKETWNTYHVIGEAMRGRAPAGLARSDRVMAALAAEPTVLAPRRQRVLETTLGRVALAAAASVATIGMVSWVGTQGAAPGVSAPAVAKGTPAMAIQPVAATATVPAAAQPQPATIDVQDYLAAHRQMPSPQAYRPVANREATPAR